MNLARSLIASIVFLGLGLGLVLGHLHDSTVGFTVGHPVAAGSLQVILHTEGVPAMAGVAATLVGVLLLFAALVLAVVQEINSRQLARGRKSPVAHA